MLPGQIVALYLHSGLPDDLGIQYQTYNRNEIVAEDDHIALMPGLGHTVYLVLRKQLLRMLMTSKSDFLGV